MRDRRRWSADDLTDLVVAISLAIYAWNLVRQAKLVVAGGQALSRRRRARNLEHLAEVVAIPLDVEPDDEPAVAADGAEG